MKTPTADNASEDSATGSSEKDQTAEWNNVGGTRRGWKTPVTVEIKTEMGIGSTDDEQEEKVSNDVTKHRKVVPKISKKGGKDE